jgi:hypothetical protein
MQNIPEIEIDTVQHDNVSDKIHLQNVANIGSVGEQVSPTKSRR